MVNEKKPAPKAGSLSLPGVIAILTGIVSLTIFLTGKTNLPAILGISDPTPTTTASPTATASPTVSADSSPTPTPAPEATVGSIPSAMTARPPSDSDLEQLRSIWTLTDFREQTAPDYFHYSVSVQNDSAWLWDCNFCAASEAFLQYAGSVQLEFRIDGKPLPEAMFRIYDRPGIPGWVCRIWSTALSGWPADKSVNLEIVYSYDKPVSDGRVEFPAGEYHQQIVVFVEK